MSGAVDKVDNALKVWSQIESLEDDIKAFEQQIKVYEEQNAGILFQNMMANPAFDVEASRALVERDLKGLYDTLATLLHEMSSNDINALVDALGKMLEKHLEDRATIESDVERVRNLLAGRLAHIARLETFRNDLMKNNTVSVLEAFGFSKSAVRMKNEKDNQDSYKGAKLVYIGDLENLPPVIPLVNKAEVFGRRETFITTPVLDSPPQERLLGRKHAIIVECDGKYTLLDLGGINGTHVRSKDVEATSVRIHNHELQHGDVITFGGARFAEHGGPPTERDLKSQYVFRFELGDP